MDTFFAPAARTERRRFKNQIKDISQSQVMDALLETTAGILVVLNQDRQIVAMNHNFLKVLELNDVEDALGMRLGETLNCVHAFEGPGGCGTTEYCETCGAAIAMMSAINQNTETEKICALVSDRNGSVSDICLQVRAKPVVVDENNWVLFYAQDITQQQFWLNMDRVFFHDVNNTLTALYGNAQLLQMADPDNREVSAICETIERLVNEIAIQKEFSFHKDAAYKPARSAISLSQVRKDLDGVINGHNASIGKQIISSWPDQDLILRTDPLLLSRILGNMVINALEATPDSGKIQIIVTGSGDTPISWQVINEAHIPEPIQKRIFQRYFSSKSQKGRGLGTYSMKLFGESYLKGSISFTSSRTQGTTFTFTLPTDRA